MLFTVKNFGHEFGFSAIEPIQSKITALHKIPFLTSKIELAVLIGLMNSYYKILDQIYVDMKSLFDLIHDNNKFHRNDELVTPFQQTKTFTWKDVILTEPNTNHPFCFTVVSSSIGIECVLFQMIDKGKLVVISYNSWFFTTNGQNFSYIHREVTAIVYSPTKQEIINTGSDHFIDVLNDHKPNLSFLSEKGNLAPIFYTAQMQSTKNQKLRIVYTKG